MFEYLFKLTLSDTTSTNSSVLHINILSTYCQHIVNILLTYCRGFTYGAVSLFCLTTFGIKWLVASTRCFRLLHQRILSWRRVKVTQWTCFQALFYLIFTIVHCTNTATCNQCCKCDVSSVFYCTVMQHL